MFVPKQRCHYRASRGSVAGGRWLLLALFLFIVAGCGQANTAPTAPPAMHRANPARTGVYDTQGPDDYSGVKWQFQAQDWVFTTPAIGDGLVYFGSYDGRVYAADLADGLEKWRFETDAPIIASPAAADGLVFIGGMDGNAYALNGQTGAEAWRASIGGGIIGSPVVTNDTVYFVSDNGLLLALEAKTGNELWRFQQVDAPIVYSPAVSDGTIYLPVGGGILVALDAQTGAEQWRFDPKINTRDIFSPAGDVVVDGGRVYFMTVNMDNIGFLYAIDQATHELVWRAAVPAEVFTAPTASGGLLMWGALDGVFYAVSADTGEPAWKYETGDAIFTAAAVAGDRVYVGSVDKNLYALDVQTGLMQWQFRAESPVSSPAIKDGIIYVGTEAGTLYAIQ